MTTRIVRCMALLVAAGFAVGSTSLGNPIRFSFAGVGSGELDGRPFDQASFLIDLVADTTGINHLDAGILTLRGPSTIHIDGLGESRFAVDTRVFFNPNADGIDPPGPTLGFSNDEPRNNGDDYLDLTDSSLAGYRLSSPIGPITTDRIAGVEQFVSAPTTQGAITFDSVDTVTFFSTNDTGVIPLPRASLTGAGFAGVIGLRWMVRHIRRSRRHELLPA